MGPMGCDLYAVMDVLGKSYRKLEDGSVVVWMNDREYRAYVFDLAYIGDMPQQNKNAGVANHKGDVSCRLCHVDIEARHNLSYDIYHNARFYHREEERRSESLKKRTQGDRKTALRETGLLNEASPFLQARLTLDPFTHFPPDPCHVLLSGIHGLIQDLLIDWVLTKETSQKYGELMREFPYTSDWSRLQDAYVHYCECSNP